MHDIWHIRLLGGLRLQRRERVVQRFRTQKTAALLAYLACHRHRSHPRETLIEMFWPEAGEESGRHSLSLALSSLRNQLEEAGTTAGGVVVADRWSVELNPDAVTTDVAAFEQALRLAAQSRDEAVRTDALSRAVDVYIGPLLPGFYDEWVLSERERLSERHLQALRQLTALRERAGDMAGALDGARRGVEADPLREETHGELIRLLAASGQTAAALRQYRELERLLDREFGATPGTALRQLAREIERHEAAPSPTAVELPTRLDDRAPVRPAADRAPATPPTGTVTFLLTDIEGSTTRWEHSHDAFRVALSRHHALLRQEFLRHGGFEFKETGDGFMTAFASAGDALACAVAAQRALATQGWPAEVGDLRVRMAVHSGDADVEDGDYHGPTPHRASRIVAAAHGGQILCSEATSGLLRRDLETEVVLRDLGVFRLRDIDLPERLFQVDWAGMEARDFPPPRAERARTGSLPLQFTRFFGREDEIANLTGLLAPDAPGRLVTLTGPGGTGKTRLAIEAAGRLADAYAGAVWFVPLADIADPVLLSGAAASALGLPPDALADPDTALADALTAQRSLLLLDNLEQVVDGGAEWVQALLERVPTVTCLVTSRQVLGLSGEREFPVAPLPVPGAAGSPEGLGVFESVRLFVDRAQAVKPDFRVTNTNAPAVAELCNRLEGIPLAIELAAARALVMTPAQMLQQLAHRFDLLVSRRRGVAERQRTLRAAIDWSYRLLSPELQRFFARLSVLRGGWTVDAAEAVTGEPLTLDLLAQLREGSLVQTDVGVTEMRFRMLETLRDFAREQLAPEEAAVADEAHARFFVDLAERGEAALRGDAQQEWLQRLDEAHDNLRAALGWTAAAPERRAERLRLCGALWYFWSIRGHLSEGRARLAEALETVSADDPDAGLLPLRARALMGAGVLACDQGRATEGAVHLEESVALLREQGTSADLATALNLLGNAALDLGATGRAQACYEEALALCRAADDRRGASILTSNLGVLAHDEGDLPRAVRLLEESIRLKRILGNRYGLANSLDSLGSVARDRGDAERAVALYAESLEIRRELGHRVGIAVTLNNLGHLDLARGDAVAARGRFGEALALMGEIEEWEGISESLAGLAGVVAAEGVPETAARLFGAVDALRAADSVRVPPDTRAQEARLAAAVRDTLGAERFDRLAAEGARLDWNAATALAGEDAAVSPPNDLP